MIKEIDMDKIMSEILLNMRTEDFSLLNSKKIKSSFTLNDEVKEINITVLKTTLLNELLEELSKEVFNIIEEYHKKKFRVEFINEETDNSDETKVGINKSRIEIYGYNATWNCSNNSGVITFEDHELFNFAMKEIRKYKEYGSNKFESDEGYESLGSIPVEDYLANYLECKENAIDAKKIVFNFLKKYMFKDLYVIEAIKSNMFFLLVEDEEDNILHKMCLGDVCLDVTNSYEVVYEY